MVRAALPSRSRLKPLDQEPRPKAQPIQSIETKNSTELPGDRTLPAAQFRHPARGRAASACSSSRKRCSSWATRSSSSSSSSRVTRLSSSEIPRSAATALSDSRSRPPRSRPGSSAISSSTVSRSRLLLPRSAMRSRAAPLATLLLPCARGGRLGRDRVDEARRRLRGERRLRLLQRERPGVECRAALRPQRPPSRETSSVGLRALTFGLLLAPRVLRLPLLPDREDRRCEEDRGVGARRDADDEREGEVLERRAAEDLEADDRQQRDERRGQRAPDRLPQRDVRDRRERRAPHQRDVLADAVEDDDRVVDRVAEHG